MGLGSECPWAAALNHIGGGWMGGWVGELVLLLCTSLLVVGSEAVGIAAFGLGGIKLLVGNTSRVEKVFCELGRVPEMPILRVTLAMGRPLMGQLQVSDGLVNALGHLKRPGQVCAGHGDDRILPPP